MAAISGGVVMYVVIFGASGEKIAEREASLSQFFRTGLAGDLFIEGGFANGEKCSVRVVLSDAEQDRIHGELEW